MEIDNHRPPSAGGADERAPLRAIRGGAPPAGEPSTAGASGGTDSLALSGRAAFLQRLDAAIAAAPATDDRRIDAVRQKIDSNSFTIDPARVAEKLIRTELALARHGQD
jgi:negative regulator of flagellin synthesis FlgM